MPEVTENEDSHSVDALEGAPLSKHRLYGILALYTAALIIISGTLSAVYQRPRTTLNDTLVFILSAAVLVDLALMVLMVKQYADRSPVQLPH